MFFLDLLFPNRCLECNRIIPAAELVCGNCFAQINFSHHDFTQSNILKEKCKLLFPVENAFALMVFEEESVSRKIIHQLKYGSREKVGGVMAKWVIENLDFHGDRPHLLVTVPLHPKKEKERGYNQLHLFGDTLSEEWEIPCDHSLIRRNFYKKAQAKKNKEERVEIENLFSLTNHISGKHILLIDDVFTTGNTMSSLAWEILKNPDNKVSVLVMALD